MLTAGLSVTAQPVRLLVSGQTSDNVLRYDGVMGAFIDAFVPAASGGLNNPTSLLFDNDGDNCPFVANTDQTDSDGDGVPNSADKCPTDPDKADPGQCGCGSSSHGLARLFRPQR